MTDEQKKAELRAYKREWNKNNKDKVAAAQKRYFEKRVKQAAEQMIIEMGYIKPGE